MTDKAILRIRGQFPWPDVQPDVPEDWHGWLAPETAVALTGRLNESTKLVVECGTWLGFSARAILQSAPNVYLFCIDTWKGSPEHWADTGEWHRRLATLHEACRRNLWPWRDRCTLIQKDSLVGLGIVYDAGCVPDAVYIDSLHEYGRVTAELAICREFWPQAVIVGDDYNNAAVKLAADDHAKMFGRNLIDQGTAFSFDGTRK